MDPLGGRARTCKWSLHVLDTVLQGTYVVVSLWSCVRAYRKGVGDPYLLYYEEQKGTASAGGMFRGRSLHLLCLRPEDDKTIDHNERKE